jgi:hypothetical protein
MVTLIIMLGAVGGLIAAGFAGALDASATGQLSCKQE